MRKIVILLSLIFLVGCGNSNDNKDNNKEQIKIENSQIYTVGKENINEKDINKVENFVDDFLTEYYLAVETGKSFDMSIFVENQDLTKYIEEGIFYIQYPKKQRIKEKDFTIDNEIKNVAWNTKDNYVYLEVITNLKDRSIREQFIIENEDGKLDIADFYNEYDKSLDETIRPNKIINDKGIWDDGDWNEYVNKRMTDINNN